jgi:hypothetical protein
VNQGIIPGPRLVVVTRAIVATGSYGPKGFDPRWDVPQGAEEADGVEGVTHAVRSQIAHGADWIKLYGDYRWGPNGEARPTFSIEELTAAVETARSSGRPVAVHATTAEGMRRAALAGVECRAQVVRRAGDAQGERLVEHLVVPRGLVVRVEQDVRMRIDQSGENGRARKLDDASVGRCPDLRGWSRAFDPVTANEDRPPVVDVGAIEDARRTEEDRGRRRRRRLLGRSCRGDRHGSGDRGQGEAATDGRSGHERRRVRCVAPGASCAARGA